MSSVAYVHRLVKQVFEEDAPRLARQVGMRERNLEFTQLALLLVLGWWQHPQAGPSALARFAGSLGVTVSKQAVDGRWSERMAEWLLALLRQAVQYLVSREATTPDWMARFTAVWVEDGSTVSLPEALARLWGRGRREASQGRASQHDRFGSQSDAANGPQRGDMAGAVSARRTPP